MLRRNLIANYIGRLWTALMGFLFVPVYIRYLGIEAYGLIGLFGVFLTWLALLDAGLKPALGREMARYTGGGISEISAWDLLRSIEIICIGIAILITVAMLWVSDWGAIHWVKAESLDSLVVEQSLFIMGLVAALRFIEGVYSSCLSGLQHHVLMNTVSAAMATLRAVGAVAILAWVDSSIIAFFLWQLIMSVATLILFLTLTYRVLPSTERSPRFSVGAIRETWKFAGGMLAITALALLLTQIDKVLLSTLIPLADFGRYVLASVAAGVLFTMISPITITFLPRLTQLHAARNNEDFVQMFHRAAQLVVVIGGSSAAVMSIYAEPLLMLWLQDKILAHQTANLLSLLAIGNLLNGLCHIPYQAQLAHGITKLAIITNAVAAVILVPMIFIIVPVYGVLGAAWIWVVLNTGYMIVVCYFMFRMILQTERTKWLINDIFKPLLAAIYVVSLGKWVLPDQSSPLLLFFIIAATTTTAGIAAMAMSNEFKGMLKQLLSHLKKSKLARNL